MLALRLFSLEEEESELEGVAVMVGVSTDTELLLAFLAFLLVRSPPLFWLFLGVFGQEAEASGALFRLLKFTFALRMNPPAIV